MRHETRDYVWAWRKGTDAPFTVRRFLAVAAASLLLPAAVAVLLAAAGLGRFSWLAGGVAMIGVLAIAYRPSGTPSRRSARSGT